MLRNEFLPGESVKSRTGHWFSRNERGKITKPGTAGSTRALRVQIRNTFSSPGVSGWKTGWRESSANRRYRSLGCAAPFHPWRPWPRDLVHLLGSQASTASPSAAAVCRFPRQIRKSGAWTLVPGRGRGGAGSGVADALLVSSLGSLAGGGGLRRFRGGDYSPGHACRKTPLGPPKRSGRGIAREATFSLLRKGKLPPSLPF